MRYEGKPMTFLIAPQVLASLARKRGECEIAPGRLKVRSEKYTFVACLVRPDQDNTQK